MPRIRLQFARGDAQESRFAAAIAPDEPDAFAFVDRDGGAVEHGVRTVADGEFGGAGDGVGHFAGKTNAPGCGWKKVRTRKSRGAAPGYFQASVINPAKISEAPSAIFGVNGSRSSQNDSTSVTMMLPLSTSETKETVPVFIAR